MKTWLKLGAAGMTLAAATSGLLAQPVPVVPVVPVAPVVPAPVVPLAPVPATPVVTVWAKLGLSKADLAACREKFCASPLGGLIHNMLRPAAALSGGIIGSCCPDVPSAADVARAKAEGPPSAGAAAAIKKDEAEAKKRRADIRYLGTVDCNWWPEAQKALAAGLRADRNECVRLEAALALGSGCCCTPVTIKALSICVAGTKEDGNPRENSDRVRAAAQMALLHCLETFAEVTEEPAKIEQQKERPPERPPEKLPEKVPEPRPALRTRQGGSAGPSHGRDSPHGHDRRAKRQPERLGHPQTVDGQFRGRRSHRE
jgi:hypothetical protein